VNNIQQIDCEAFDGHAEELALGQVDEPLRGRLLAHAAGCPHCHSLIDGLGTVADRLLLAAPQIEPPADFENRALARLGAPTGGAIRRVAGFRWVVGAAVIGAVAAAGVLLAFSPGDRQTNLATAAIVATAGTEVGSAQLIAEPTPHLLVSIPAPRPGPGIRTCELRRADGEWEEVGWWDAAGIASGVWAVGIDAALLDATDMRITSGGDVIATATFG
jgi:hypothetical protein